MNKAPPGQVRIIAGSLRGSKLPVADRPGLRPTSDRARETLFNWLQQQVAGRRVLDLFAGTGALGFEAASRGAAEVTLVERDPALAQGLRETAARLKAANVGVECADALEWLGRPVDRRYDLAFVDPPYADDLWARTIGALAPWLAEEAWVHVESAASASYPVPAHWRLHRELAGREARHALYRLDRPGKASAPGGAGTLDDESFEPGSPPA
jgi:16S rRNA (guanine966-N2)-methyltransferase